MCWSIVCCCFIGSKELGCFCLETGFNRPSFSKVSSNFRHSESFVMVPVGRWQMVAFGISSCLKNTFVFFLFLSMDVVSQGKGLASPDKGYLRRRWLFTLSTNSILRFSQHQTNGKMQGIDTKQTSSQVILQFMNGFQLSIFRLINITTCQPCRHRRLPNQTQWGEIQMYKQIHKYHWSKVRGTGQSSLILLQLRNDQLLTMALQMQHAHGRMNS